MSSLDLELDGRMDDLELEWRADLTANAAAIDSARERLRRDRELGAEAAGELIERRWFALLSAIRSLQGECGILLEASKLADIAWRRACVQLAEFEALRDALEDQMCARPSLGMKQATRLKAEARSGYRDVGTH